MKSYINITSFILLFQFVFCVGYSQSINKYNKHGERTGKWVTYIDDTKKIKSMQGRYRNGKSVGKNYYYSEGVLERREICRFKKMKTTFYYPSGKIKRKGNARIDNTKTEIHYYFYGTWKSYKENGELEKIATYQKGKLITTKYLDKSILLNDSLMIVIDEIDKEFTSHNKQLTDSIKKYTNNLALQKNYQVKLKIADSISFKNIEHIFKVFGYPSQKTVGQFVDIPFFIISYAPVYIKERCTSIFAAAATKGDISLKSYALFIDKLKVAKGEKQIYGTQFYYDKNNKRILYPCENKENINKIRESVGLENLEE